MQIDPSTPFPVYVQSVLGVSDETAIGKLASCCANHVLFGDDPDKLRLLVEQWFTIRHVATTLGFDDHDVYAFQHSSSTVDPTCLLVNCAAEDLEHFLGHVISIMQHCLDAYFSENWGAQKRVIEANLQYRAYASQTADTLLKSRSPVVPDASIAEVHGALPSRNNTLLQVTESQSYGSTTFRDLMAAESDRGFALVFHAAFSTASSEALGVCKELKSVGLHPTPMKVHRSSSSSSLSDVLPSQQVPIAPADLPVIGVVNSAAEIELVQRFNVKWYPTIVMVFRNKTVVYPEDGSRQPHHLAEWMLSGGNTPVHYRRLKNAATRALQFHLQSAFATIRSLHFAVLMMQRLRLTALQDKQYLPIVSQRGPDDPPMFIFLGGGMASGKTTAMMQLTQTEWWARHGSETVQVDADEFKRADPLWRTGVEDVHSQSVKSAELLLVNAINRGRDVIFDGTMSWEPFVMQTVEMVRLATNKVFRCGRGFVPSQNVEEYWVAESNRTVPLPAPYTIRVIGLTVEPGVAIARGIIRQLRCGRVVPVSAQLRSYKLFAIAFEKYVARVDEAILINNNRWNGQQSPEDEHTTNPQALIMKASGGSIEIFDELAFAAFRHHTDINYLASRLGEVFGPIPEETTRSPTTPTPKTYVRL